MSLVVKGDGVIGKIAIYEGPDDAPYDYPIANRTRSKIHSDFKYLGIVSDSTVTAQISASNPTRRQRINILAHGRSGGVPLINGSLLGIGAGGSNVPFVGSVPVWLSGGYRNGVWWTLGVDATYVYIHEMWSKPDLQSNSPTPGTPSFSIRVFVFNRYIV